MGLFGSAIHAVDFKAVRSLRACGAKIDVPIVIVFHADEKLVAVVSRGSRLQMLDEMAVILRNEIDIR